MTRTATLLIVACLLVPTAVAQTVSCGSSEYTLIQTNGIADARAQAAALGGHLATINGAAENAFLWQTFGATTVFIGLSDEVSEGNFVWDSGEPVTYTNWSAGEPNNQGNEDYTLMRASDGKWNDAGGAGPRAAIVEFSRKVSTGVSTYNGSLKGVMFDVSATESVTVCSFDVQIYRRALSSLPVSQGNLDVEVYAVTGGGSWVGNQGRPTNWTLLGSATVNGGPNRLTRLNLNLERTILAGETQGFHLYTPSAYVEFIIKGTSNPRGSVIATDGVVSLHAGQGDDSPFEARDRPVSWSGAVRYAPAPQFTVSYNQPASGALELHVVNGPPNHRYLYAFTFAAANANGGLGSGWWGGLHIPFHELALLVATPVVPFQGVLDANGELFYSWPDEAASVLAGLTVYANVHAFDPATGIPSDVTEPIEYTIQ